MRRSILGKTDKQVSILGCGTMWFKDLSQTQTTKTLNYALDRGVTYFDCARGYGDAEIKVGKAISTRHDEFFIATKTVKRDYKSACQEIDESLERLGTDYLDLIQLHYVNEEHEFQEIMSHMQTATCHINFFGSDKSCLLTPPGSNSPKYVVMPLLI